MLECLEAAHLRCLLNVHNRWMWLLQYKRGGACSDVKSLMMLCNKNICTYLQTIFERNLIDLSLCCSVFTWPKKKQRHARARCETRIFELDLLNSFFVIYFVVFSLFWKSFIPVFLQKSLHLVASCFNFDYTYILLFWLRCFFQASFNIQHRDDVIRVNHHHHHIAWHGLFEWR